MATSVAVRHKKASQFFWGNMASFELSARIVMLVFVAIAIGFMSFAQLGFWPIGVVDGKPVYLILLLGPLVMGGLLYGPVMGALIGLYAGAVVYAHAIVLPLDYYEVYFMTPLNTFVLMTVVGALSGLLFTLLERTKLQGPSRAGLVVAACFVVSFAASGMLTLGTIVSYGGMQYLDAIMETLVNSPLGIVVQAIIDAVLMVLLCLGASFIVHRRLTDSGGRTLLSMFRNWMLLVSCIVFMLAGGLIFTFATLQCQYEAQKVMFGEVDYLSTKVDLLHEDEYADLLEGYEVDSDGWVCIVDEKGTILVSDDEGRYPAGASFVDLLGYGEGSEDRESGGGGAGQEVAAADFLAYVESTGEMATLQAVDTGGAQTLDFAFLTVDSFDGGYVTMLRSPDMVYKNRFNIMAASTILAFLLIAAIAVLAAILLNRVVVRRVDETNVSLAKITAGDLNERVTITDSREFMSLSSGINSTVSSLKDAIDEVKQRNAQDLATAKTIQESALPREFPPFPHIDKFDIYASMKTAKEVGGDFYDFLLINDSKLGFIMADVSGKGIPAALFMMTAKTQLRNYIESDIPLNEAVDAANHQLCIGNDAGMFVTAWVGVLEFETGLLTYVNCGHNPPMILCNGAWELVKDVSGMPLGLFDGIPYDAFTRQMQIGEMLYLYTDGVTEAMNAEGDLFGEERLIRVLDEFGPMNARSVGVGVRRALTDYTKDAEQSDDITMLILKYGVPPEKKAVMVLPADDKQLVHVCNFIHEELHRRNAPKAVYNPLDIAAEELFVNVCHYAYPDATPENPGEVRISFEYEANPPSLTVQIADDGVPYDPLAKPDAVTPDDIAEVPIGGLGILMAKKSVDDMYYERKGESNVLTFVKRW